MNNRNFGFFEAVGSVILLLLDPVRWDTTKYLDKKYLKVNKVVGILAFIVLSGIAVYYLIQFIYY